MKFERLVTTSETTNESAKFLVRVRRLEAVSEKVRESRAFLTFVTARARESVNPRPSETVRERFRMRPAASENGIESVKLRAKFVTPIVMSNVLKESDTPLAILVRATETSENENVSESDIKEVTTRFIASEEMNESPSCFISEVRRLAESEKESAANTH